MGFLWSLLVRRRVVGRRLRGRNASLRRQLEDERSAHEATRRELRISQAECDALAGVVARDRARVEAETAGFARQLAEHEGRNGRNR